MLGGSQLEDTLSLVGDAFWVLSYRILCLLGLLEGNDSALDNFVKYLLLFADDWADSKWLGMHATVVDAALAPASLCVSVIKCEEQACELCEAVSGETDALC